MHDHIFKESKRGNETDDLDAAFTSSILIKYSLYARHYSRNWMLAATVCISPYLSWSRLAQFLIGTESTGETLRFHKHLTYKRFNSTIWFAFVRGPFIATFPKVSWDFLGFLGGKTKFRNWSGILIL